MLQKIEKLKKIVSSLELKLKSNDDSYISEDNNSIVSEDDDEDDDDDAINIVSEDEDYDAISIMDEHGDIIDNDFIPYYYLKYCNDIANYYDKQINELIKEINNNNDKQIDDNLELAIYYYKKIADYHFLNNNQDDLYDINDKIYKYFKKISDYYKKVISDYTAKIESYKNKKQAKEVTKQEIQEHTSNMLKKLQYSKKLLYYTRRLISLQLKYNPVKYNPDENIDNEIINNPSTLFSSKSNESNKNTKIRFIEQFKQQFKQQLKQKKIPIFSAIVIIILNFFYDFNCMDIKYYIQNNIINNKFDSLSKNVTFDIDTTIVILVFLAFKSVVLAL